MYQQTASTMALPSPSLPSPTLTNPDMILPYDGDYPISQDVPSPRHAMPPSPPRRASAGLSSHPPFAKLAQPPSAAERMASQNIDSAEHTYSHGRPLSDIQETETTPKGRRSRNDLLNRGDSSPPLASSPTLALAQRGQTGSSRPKDTLTSSTVNYYGFDRDELAIEDDSDDEITTYGDDEEDAAELENIKRLRRARLQYHGGIDGAIPEENQDPYLSAALSKRAERILANAKQRLDNMEGNLNRARNSLIISSGPFTTSADNSPAMAQGSFSSIHGTERRLHPPLGISPAKHRQVKLKSAVASNAGHSRVFSETSIPSTLNTTPQSKKLDSSNPRSISAFENESAAAKPRINGLSPAAVAVLQGIRKEESEEALRKKANGHRSTSPQTPLQHSPSFERHLAKEDKEHHGLARQLSTSASLYNIGVEASDNANGLSRSKSTAQMRDLRVQMNDLKGKISNLQQKAREEGMKRRSLQSLRTPSPFTAAEQWYTTSADYKPAPQKSNLGLHATDATTSPGRTNVHPPAPERHDSALNGYAESITQSSTYHDADEELDSVDSEEAAEDLIKAYESSDRRPNGSHNDASVSHLEENELEITEITNDDDDSLSSGERHEDREDAFDYQNFYLHSGMGNYSQTDKLHRTRDSCSSSDSVETTRGIQTTSSASRFPNHQRNTSSDSVSTVATFATATEGFESHSEDSTSDDERDPARHLPPLGSLSPQTQTQPAPYLTQPRSPPKIPSNSTSAAEAQVHVTKPTLSTTAIPSYQPSLDDVTPTTREFPLINRPKSSSSSQRSNGKIQSSNPSSTVAQLVRARNSPSPTLSTENMSEYTDATSISGSSIREGGAQLSPGDRALVEALVEAMGDVCVRLKREEGGPRAGIWRGRLEAARRVLEGAVL